MARRRRRRKNCKCPDEKRGLGVFWQTAPTCTKCDNQPWLPSASREIHFWVIQLKNTLLRNSSGKQPKASASSVTTSPGYLQLLEWTTTMLAITTTVPLHQYHLHQEYQPTPLCTITSMMATTTICTMLQKRLILEANLSYFLVYTSFVLQLYLCYIYLNNM